MARKDLESDFRKEVKEYFSEINAAGVFKTHVSWIESHETSPGIPDIEYCISDSYGIGCRVNNVELKVLGHSMEVRSSQLLWFRERVKAGGLPFLLIKVPIDSPRVVEVSAGVTRGVLSKEELIPGVYAIPGSKVEYLFDNPNARGIYGCNPALISNIEHLSIMLMNTGMLYEHNKKTI